VEIAALGSFIAGESGSRRVFSNPASTAEPTGPD